MAAMILPFTDKVTKLESPPPPRPLSTFLRVLIGLTSLVGCVAG